MSMIPLENARSGYEFALVMKNDVTKQARLLNALSHLHIKSGGTSHLALEHLETSGTSRNVIRNLAEH